MALSGLLLAACGQSAPGTASTALGTRWGEDIASAVGTAQLKRQGDLPKDVRVLNYSAAEVAGETLPEVSLAGGRVGLRVLTEQRRPWPIRRTSQGLHLQGQMGARYILEYRNHTKDETFEIVATVDGLDVLTGRPGRLKANGYALRPGEVLHIDGFRKSADQVAAFRFGRVDESYAATGAARSAEHAGVIGTAVFGLRIPYGVQPAAQSAACQKPPCAFSGEKSGTITRYAQPPSGQ